MAVIKKDGNIMALPLSIKRGNPIPIDATQVWYEYDELATYAQSDVTAYVGQICTVVNEAASTAEAYMITSTGGNLVKLAQTTASGDLTQDVIELQGQVADILEDIGAYDTAVAGDGSVYGAIKTVENSVTTLSNNLTSNYYDKTTTDSKISEAVSAAISSTYKAAGSVASIDEITVDAAHEGYVYNMSAEFTTTDAFVEGAGITYPAGTNVAVIEVSDGVYKLDVLAGFVDTSDFVTDESLTTTLGNYVQKETGKSLVDDTLITKLQNQTPITSVSSELSAAGGELSIVSVDPSKVTGLSDALSKVSGMANIKTVADGELAVSEEGELSVVAIAQDKVTGLPAALASKVDAVAGKGLSTNDFTDELEEKLNGITAGAQPNVIEVIQANGTALPISEKTVNIPAATAQALGLVKGSDAENKVAVAADGTMEVNSLNVSKLTQTEGDTLILNGGDSTSASA